KTSLDCLPCFIRQTLDAVRFATSDTATHEVVLRKVLALVAKMDLKMSPPQMGQIIHRMIRKISGNNDPYKVVKDRYNAYALGLYPSLKERIGSTSNKIEIAVRLAIAGNIIDFGIYGDVDQAMINNAIESSLSDQLSGDISLLLTALSTAKNILYLGDNAGEIVFDRLLIELLQPQKITFAVRGNPVLNDATMDDAIETGMTDIVTVIDNGSDAPGTLLAECPRSFQQIFQEADLIISKGQGNFETLSGARKNIFFLLKAKCPIIAEKIGCKLGDAVIYNAN
ncbi:ARMT1-like domain-containing protein, partial [Desulfobacterales bacterium HSG17]|nr:ARMT1-like domain-containing protein [Desulfobacterales bacterium HSG17]